MRVRVSVLLLLAACASGAGRTTDALGHADSIVIAADLVAPDLPAAPGDMPADPVEAPDGPSDDGPAGEVPPEPAGDLPPPDEGHEVAVGTCAPGDTSCWCTNDSHCNPSYSQACRPNTCDATTGHCALDKNRLEGHSCDDLDVCTSPDACHDGECVAGPKVCECKADGDCDDHEACTLDTCGAGNACQQSPLDGACDDGDPCTGPDACGGGHCVAGPFTCECKVASDCDDADPCTDDSCASSHCQHAANTATCDDGDPLTVGDHCSGGICVPGIKCGDGTCNGTEACDSCPGDCGPCPTVETACGDGIDDDSDGMTDCKDPDCAGKSPCPTDACSGKVKHVFTCGDSVSGLYNSIHNITGSGCGDKLGNWWNNVFRFDATATQQVHFQVTHEDDPGDEFHLWLLDYVCAASACEARGCCSDPGVTIGVVAGASYFIAVGDNNPVGSGSYTLSVTCP
jgi:hypothetical protein